MSFEFVFKMWTLTRLVVTLAKIIAYNDTDFGMELERRNVFAASGCTIDRRSIKEGTEQ